MADEGRLGYLTVQPSADGQAFAGGLLTTDSELRPLDFRCTAAIRPTAIQKALYGAILRQHVFVDLLGLTLVRGADPQPDLILFEDPVLLYLQRKVESTPALWTITNAETNEEEVHPPVDTQHLKLTAVSAGTIGIFVYPGYGERVTQVKALLEEVATHFDLLEPFRRMAPLLAQVLQPTQPSGPPQ